MRAYWRTCVRCKPFVSPFMKNTSNPQRKVSLAAQYTAMIVSLTLLGMLALAFTLLTNQYTQNERYINDFGRIISSQLAAAAVDPLFAERPFELDILINRLPFERHIVGAGIYSIEKETIASKGLLPATKEMKFNTRVYKLHNKGSYQYGLNNDHIVHSVPITFKDVTAGYAVLVFSQEALVEQFQQQISSSIVITLLLLLVVTLGAFYIARKLSNPIMDIVAATQSIREGNLDPIPDRRNGELGNLVDAINTMSQGLVRKTELEAMLNRFLAKDVAKKVMDKLDPVEMAGEHVEATVVFADIVGFTSISENIEPEEVQKLLNEYWSYYNACARFYFGTVDKYIGDCMMLVFGVPTEDPKHQYNAVACAILMQKLTERLNQRRKDQGLYPVELRVGINSGKMLAGLIGTSDRMEYTVVGDAVNLASRLCNEAEGAQIIIEDSLFKNINPMHRLNVEAYKEISIRGKTDKVKIYSVNDVEHPYQVVMDDLISDILSKNSQ